MLKMASKYLSPTVDSIPEEPLVPQAPESLAPEEIDPVASTVEESLAADARVDATTSAERHMPPAPDDKKPVSSSEIPSIQTLEPRSQTTVNIEKDKEMPESPPLAVGTVGGEQVDGEQSDATTRAASPTPTSISTTTHSSGSSSGSGSTVRQSSFTRRRSLGKENEQDREPRKSSPRQRPPPDALSFLEPDSPAVTPEAIQRSIELSSRRRASGGSSRMSPGARSSTSSGSSFHSDVFSVGDHETDRSSSPEQSVNGDSPSTTHPRSETQASNDRRRQRGSKSYGTPEMPRGNANLPHIPPNALQPRLPQYSGHIKHLPRAEKLPLSGYELIAAKLSPGPSGHPTIQPMYRRFEALNHRVLLHLQDELAELEQQLSNLDTLDTQTRRSLNGIIPASRRKEYLAPSELQWQKTDVLGKIGYKLGQYNHVLASFKDTQSLPTPAAPDVSDYRSYLATHNPIAEIETRFLDLADDLVSLARPNSRCSDRTDSLSSGAPTPMPQFSAESVSTLPTSPSECDKDSLVTKASGSQSATLFEPTPTQLAVAVGVSFLLPILTFSVIPSFVGRMIVVFLVALGVLSPLMQSKGSLGVDATTGMILASIYGGVMAVVAAIFS